MVEGLLLGEFTGIHQFLDIGVILGQLNQTVLFVEDITAAVSSPADISFVVENPGHDDSSTHTTGTAVFLAPFENVQVG